MLDALTVCITGGFYCQHFYYDITENTVLQLFHACSVSLLSHYHFLEMFGKT